MAFGPGPFCLLEFQEHTKETQVEFGAKSSGVERCLLFREGGPLDTAGRPRRLPAARSNEVVPLAGVEVERAVLVGAEVVDKEAVGPGAALQVVVDPIRPAVEY